jgi:tetrahydromethanopterin S-methyltransferase subunit C
MFWLFVANLILFGANAGMNIADLGHGTSVSAWGWIAMGATAIAAVITCPER